MTTGLADLTLEMYTGDDGQGHTQTMPAELGRPEEPLFPERTFALMLAQLAILNSVANNLGFTGTSSSSVSIGTGDKTFTTQSGKGWVEGQLVQAVDTANPTTNGMYGSVKSYSGTTLVLTIPSGATFGSGTITSWALSPKVGVMDGPASSTDYSSVAFNGTSGKLLREISAWPFDSSSHYSGTDHNLSRVNLKDFGMVAPAVSASSTTVLDITTGNVFYVSQATDITTLTISNPSPTGTLCQIRIIREKDNSGTTRAITFPASFDWGADGTPVLPQTAKAVDWFDAWTINAGTKWHAVHAGTGYVAA